MIDHALRSCFVTLDHEIKHRLGSPDPLAARATTVVRYDAWHVSPVWLLSAYSITRHGEAWGTSAARQILEHAIETGRGGVYLKLTPEQYRRLSRF
jgi:hypothetical protein